MEMVVIIIIIITLINKYFIIVLGTSINTKWNETLQI